MNQVAPKCCGVDAFWNDNVPSKPYWFCRECKQEVSSPNHEFDGADYRKVMDELREVPGCIPPGSLVWNKEGHMTKREGHVGPVEFKTPWLDPRIAKTAEEMFQDSIMYGTGVMQIPEPPMTDFGSMQIGVAGEDIKAGQMVVYDSKTGLLRLQTAADFDEFDDDDDSLDNYE